MFSASPKGLYFLIPFFGQVNGILAHGRKNAWNVEVIGVVIFFLPMKILSC